MKDLSVTEFRRECLSLLEKLPEDGVIITKRGKPLAKVLPAREPRPGKRVKLPMIAAKGKPGPRRPNLQAPYDVLFD